MTEPEESNHLGWHQAKKYFGPSPASQPDNQIAVTSQLFAAWLIRTNYVVEVGKLIDPTWVLMEERQLTAYLSQKLSKVQIEQLFAKKSELRLLLKKRARNFSIFAAVAIALIWCRDDLESGRYGQAGMKFTATVGGALALNYYFYRRDKTAAQIMSKNMGNFGKWFQGVARTNRFVNFLLRRVAPALLIWDMRGIIMSGGMDGPNIPFDFIIEIDIFDRATWRKPPDVMLDFGMDFFYYQKPTKQWPVGYQQVCFSVIRGSLLRAPKRWLGISHNTPPPSLTSTSKTASFSPCQGGPKVNRGPAGYLKA
jgi:hypothetical protein